ncbi:hypothetical protein ACJJTC_011366, partial [Scirpophaga incertulas]
MIVDIQNINTDIDVNVNVGDAFHLDDIDKCRDIIVKSAGDFNIITQNIRSVSRNIDDFVAYLARLKIKIDVIVLMECWLLNLVSLPTIPDYIGYSSSNHTNQNSGVAIYVHEYLNVCVSEHKITDADSVIIRINNQITLLGIYRSPSIQNIDNFLDSLNDVLNKLKQNSNKILIGDLNIDIKEDTLDQKSSNYLDLLSTHGMLPSHVYPTRGTACLDHCFLYIGTKASTLVHDTSITDHSSVIVSLKNCTVKHSKLKSIKIIDYSKAISDLGNNCWLEIYNCKDPEVATCRLIDILSSVLSRNTVDRAITNRQTAIKPWITTGLMRCIRWRDKLHQKLKKDPDNLTLRVTYRRYRNHCNNLLHSVKASYENSELLKNKNNIKGTWKVLRQICHMKGNNKPAAELLGVQDTPEKSVNHVNEYFVGVGKSFADDILLKLNTSESELANKIKTKPSPSGSLSLLPTDANEIKKVIMSLKSTASTGWD